MSAILSADDLNDFISPGAVCIKPTAQLTNKENDTLNENGEVEIQIDSEGNPLEISKIDGKQKSLSPAQISLADCLACSGCITSAEEVLVAQHSHEELIKALKEKINNNSNKVFVASVSHQTRASLATAYNLTVEEVDKLLVNLFINQMGFKYIVGTSLGRKLSLINEAQILIEKKEQNNLDGPILSSICPGWVLYAEKTHPYVIPKMSTVKSPQQITGCLLKTLAAHELPVNRSDIYHLSLMPCFDKKLESARPEKYGETTTNDVDCVLTAKELVNLLEQHSDDFQLIPPQSHVILSSSVPITETYAKCAPKSWPFVDYSWSNDSGSASGGYGYNYLKLYQNHLILKDPINYQQEGFSLKSVEGRNADIYELRLMYGNTTVASTAIVNGFRNIQNLVRKLKPSNKPATSSGSVKVNPLAARRRARIGVKASSPAGSDETADASKCDYVEIMACPNGCINGGGQINPPTEVGEKEWLSTALEKYGKIPIFDISSQSSVDAVREIVQWSENFCHEFGISDNRLLKTWFNEVEKPTDAAAILLGARW
ncbi:nuclear architecture related protein [Scheffersomyces xylosifermentans]|uniref:nuclear architecture related protein n=1 Tax=Scheffersomyces xylosifermentans TaxID=1304137 RepID=UPI00315CED4B